MPRITLIGYRGTGKSTVAAAVADRLGCAWHDADAILEARLGGTIAALIRDRGEPAFRDAEAAILAEQLGSFAGVLATGGGVVLRDGNRRLLRTVGRPVVWLTAPVDVIRARLSADPATRDRRPALSGGDPLDEIATAVRDREPLYRECADLVVDAGSEAPDRLAGRIVDWLGGLREPPGPEGLR